MNKCYPEKVIKIAEAEIGYKEKASNSQLYDKTANAGYNNYTKYANDIDTKYPDIYNGKKNGYDWCDVFVDWCFIQAYGREDAQRLLCQPNKSCGAGCDYSYGYYEAKGQTGKAPRLGAQIFFGDLDHTGIVVDYDDSFVWTVEGNTGSGVNEVCKKKYSRGSTWIYGYGYPAYDEEAEPTGETWTGNYPKLPKRGYYLTGDGYNVYKNLQSDIKSIQEFLNWAIDAGLEVDGYYGEKTTEAVEKFQKKVGIDVDGSYGKDTLAAAKVFTKASTATPTPNPTPTTTPTPSGKVVKASQSAESFKESLAKEYKVNAKSGLNLRDGASTDYKVLCTLPYGHMVENYGYYTDRSGIRWLYVSTTLNGTEYIGFVSSVLLNS